MMEVLRGANLIGISKLPLDVCPFSLFIQKKKARNVEKI